MFHELYSILNHATSFCDLDKAVKNMQNEERGAPLLEDWREYLEHWHKITCGRYVWEYEHDCNANRHGQITQHNFVFP